MSTQQYHSARDSVMDNIFRHPAGKGTPGGNGNNPGDGDRGSHLYDDGLRRTTTAKPRPYVRCGICGHIVNSSRFNHHHALYHSKMPKYTIQRYHYSVFQLVMGYPFVVRNHLSIQNRADVRQMQGWTAAAVWDCIAANIEPAHLEPHVSYLTRNQHQWPYLDLLITEGYDHRVQERHVTPKGSAIRDDSDEAVMRKQMGKHCHDDDVHDDDEDWDPTHGSNTPSPRQGGLTPSRKQMWAGQGIGLKRSSPHYTSSDLSPLQHQYTTTAKSTSKSKASPSPYEMVNNLNPVSPIVKVQGRKREDEEKTPTGDSRYIHYWDSSGTITHQLRAARQRIRREWGDIDPRVIQHVQRLMAMVYATEGVEIQARG